MLIRLARTSSLCSIVALVLAVLLGAVSASFAVSPRVNQAHTNPVMAQPQVSKPMGVKAHQPWSPTFKEDFHKGFMQACVDGVAKKTGVKPAQNYCSCFASDIEANFSEEELTTMSKASNTREQMNQAFQPTVDKCSPRILDGLE
ncbi:MAG: hypothetical protein ACKO37_01060 [Vampirovibrionales bacterium]